MGVPSKCGASLEPLSGNLCAVDIVCEAVGAGFGTGVCDIILGLV